MKIVIVNILVLILIFNLIMIIFPEGKTQKFCRISIKILIMIYIIDNIFFSGSLNFNSFNSKETAVYQREISLKSISPEIINSINEENFQSEEVVSNITFKFTDKMDVHLYVVLNRIVGNEELKALKENISEIFQQTDNIDFIYASTGGIYE